MLNKKATFIPTNKTLYNGDVVPLTSNERDFLEEYAQLCLRYELQFILDEHDGVDTRIELGKFTNKADGKLDLFWGF